MRGTSAVNTGHQGWQRLFSAEGGHPWLSGRGQFTRCAFGFTTAFSGAEFNHAESPAICPERCVDECNGDLSSIAIGQNGEEVLVVAETLP